MKKEVKLYNLIFPVWLLFIFPIAWLVIVPANFIVDSLVLLLGMKKINIIDKKGFYKKHIFKVFIFGILADIIGALYMFIMMFVFETAQRGDELSLTIPGVLISFIMIFVFNYFITFKKLERKERFKLALIIAIITAPYTFLTPIDWYY